MDRAEIVWVAAVALIAAAIAPALKAVGLLPHDLLVSWGILFPGLEQMFFGPLMAALLLLCFLKTKQAVVFPVISLWRAVILGFVFPANLQHLGTGIAGIVAGVMAAILLKNVATIRLGLWLPLLAALFAGLYAAGNYLTAIYFGPAAQTRIILLSPALAAAVVCGSFALGGFLGVTVAAGMRLVRGSQTSGLSPRATT